MAIPYIISTWNQEPDELIVRVGERMPQLQMIDRSHVVTSGEASTGLVTIRERFGGTRRVILKTMSVIDITDEWKPCYFGLTIGGKDVGLKVGYHSPHNALHWDGNLPIDCSGFWWVIRRPTAADVVRFEATWDE